MSCCTDAKLVSKLTFLESKSVNFIKYLESWQPDDEVKGYINSFQPSLLTHTIQTIIVPIVQLQQLDFTVDELTSHLTIPDSQKGEVKTKLKAYLQMFNDVLLQ